MTNHTDTDLRSTVTALAKGMTAEFPEKRRSEHAVTCLGAHALITIIRSGRLHTSERVVITEWIDASTPENGNHPAGTFTIQHIEGDGRIRPELVGAMTTHAHLVVSPDGTVSTLV